MSKYAGSEASLPGGGDIEGSNWVSRVEARDLANSVTGEEGVEGVFVVVTGSAAGISVMESMDSSPTDSKDDCRESESIISLVGLWGMYF